MLQKETVAPGTLELLKHLMGDTRLEDFILVGGTALALQIGHRKSVDLDFFSTHFFDEGELASYLEVKNHLMVDFLSSNTLKGSINGIKVDFITHAYPLVREGMVLENIRLASLDDIAAFKLNAIIGNGTRLKDFVDIAFLSASLSLRSMLAAFETKYNTRNPVLAIKALAYHEDININEPLSLINAKLNWKRIASRIHEMIQFPDRVFPVPAMV
jgi:hypothetical protein